jgi:hypothetical protein
MNTKPILERNSFSLAHPTLPLPAGEVHPETDDQLLEMLTAQKPPGEIHEGLRMEIGTPPAEAIASLWEIFPTPNCRFLFEQLLDRWAKPTQDKELKVPILLIGEAGTGKTSTCENTAKFVFGLRRHSKNPEENPEPIFFAAGGRNLNELLIEPIFDQHSEPIAKTIMDAYNQKGLRTMTQPSRRLIEERFPEAITEGTINLFNIELNPGNLETLTQVAQFEGLLKRESTLGVELTPGPLIQACKQGRVLVVDEVDKAVPGGAKLNEVIQALSGRVKNPVEFNDQGISFTFSRENIHGDFDMVMTANNLADGGEMAGIRESTLQRFLKILVPNVTVEDISERIAQSLLGFNPTPLSLTKGTNRQKAELATEVFTTAGKPLGDTPELLIERLDKTLQACKQLATCIRIWGKTVDPNAPTETDPILENNRGIGVETPGVRMAQGIIEDATRWTPRKTKEASQTEALPDYPDFKSLLDEMSDPENGRTQNSFQEMGLGEKIEQIINVRIAQFPAGPPTKRAFTQAAQQCAILPETDEEDNLNPKKLPLIRDLLNTLEKEIEIEPETLTLQKQLCARLKTKHPETKNTSEENLIPAHGLQKMITDLRKTAEEQRTKGITMTLGLNPDYLKGTQASPIQMVPILSSKEHSQTIEAFKESHGIETGEFLECVNHPSIRRNLMENLWAETTAAKESDFEQSLSGSNASLRMCKLLTRGAGKPNLTMILHSQKKNLLVIFNPNIQDGDCNKTSSMIITNKAQEAAKAVEEKLRDKETEVKTLLGTFCQTNDKEKEAGKEGEINPIQAMIEGNSIEQLLERATEMRPQRNPLRVPLRITEAAIKTKPPAMS